MWTLTVTITQEDVDEARRRRREHADNPDDVRYISACMNCPGAVAAQRALGIPEVSYNGQHQLAIHTPGTPTIVWTLGQRLLLVDTGSGEAPPICRLALQWDMYQPLTVQLPIVAEFKLIGDRP